MSDTPIYDQLLLEDGPPMVRTWHVDTKGVAVIETEPRFLTQFTAALAHDLLSATELLDVRKAVEQRVAEWWLAPSPVPPTLHDHFYEPPPPAEVWEPRALPARAHP